MKSLWLIRHAQALGFASVARDQQRILSEQGVDQAKRLARFLQIQGVSADLIKTSSAARALSTAKILARIGENQVIAMEIVPELYLAPAAAIWQEVTQTPDDVKTLLLVGHNPGLQDLAHEFDAAFGHLQTGSAVHLTFDCDLWTLASANTFKQGAFIEQSQMGKH